MICLNRPYWIFPKVMIDSARKFFLKGHDVDFILWTDMPDEMTKEMNVIKIPTEPFEWPLPTLMRYSLFLQEEERLSGYDYVVYVDADMAFVSKVGDEILGKGLTVAQHPMYAVSRYHIPPYEPNSESESFIPRLGRIINEEGKKRFEPIYACGGFQGGRSDAFIKAMKSMKEMIDKDFSKNYIPIWNDETAWNKYLFTLFPKPINNELIVLSPSYCYPDSLNKVYYQRVWGRNYVPKLVTITKKFSTTKEAGTALSTTLQKI